MPRTHADTLAPASPLFADALDLLMPIKLGHYPTRVTAAEDGCLVAAMTQLRSDCHHHRAGACVRNTHGRTVVTGRTGTPRGRTGCLGEKCDSLHAAENACLYTSPAERHGATLYLSSKPCEDCLLLASGTGVAALVWPARSSNGDWMLMGRDNTTGSTSTVVISETTALFTETMNAIASLDLDDYDERISSDEEAILISFAAAMRADCTRRRVGACITNASGRVVSTGRNGAPAGVPGCLSANACPRGRQTYADVAAGASYSNGSGRCIALHAERNACLYCSPADRDGGSIHVTDAPCDDCSLFVAGSGLARVLWPELHDATWVVRERGISPTHPIGGLYS